MKQSKKKKPAPRVAEPVVSTGKIAGITVGVIAVLGILIWAIVMLVTGGNVPTSGNNGNNGNNGTSSSVKTFEPLSKDYEYTAEIVIENYGTVKFKLEPESAPQTAANFVSLAEKGFYNGLTFHRIIEGFMMQGGCPNGDGYGDPGYSIKGEFTANGVQNKLSHTAGAVSMARSNDPDSGGSQFFIVHEDSRDSLDGLYAVFGYVTEGMDVVNKICTEAEPTDGNGSIPAAKQPVMKSVTIVKSPVA